jgi:hypothetical protein
MDLDQLNTGIFSKYFWASLQGFEDKTKARMMTMRLLMGLNLHGSDR